LLEASQSLMGSLAAGEWSGCQGLGAKAPIPTEPRPGVHPSEAHPLYGKAIAFTGALAIPRREAQQAAVDRGAIASRGVTRHTEVLVAGFQDLAKLARGESKSAKLRRAEALLGEGREIEILAEGDFVQLLGSVA
jgi:DNA polymerase-3 subunit epsilon